MQKFGGEHILYSSFIFMECVLWGFGNTITKVAFQSISPFYCLTIRYLLALAVYGIFYGKKLAATPAADFKRALPIGFFTAAAFISSNVALSFTSATVAGLLMGLAVIFTPFLAYFMQKTLISKRVMLAVTLVVCGMYLLTGVTGAAGFGWGEVLALLASCSFAVSLILSAKYLENSSPAVLSTVQCALAAVVSLAAALLWEDYHALAATTPTGWAAILYLALGCTCAAYLLQNAALRHVSPVFASIAFCTEPMFTAISAYLILGEKLTPAGYTGAILVIAAIMLASVNKAPAPAMEKA